MDPVRVTLYRGAKRKNKTVHGAMRFFTESWSDLTVCIQSKELDEAKRGAGVLKCGLVSGLLE